MVSFFSQTWPMYIHKMGHSVLVGILFSALGLCLVLSGRCLKCVHNVTITFRFLFSQKAKPSFKDKVTNKSGAHKVQGTKGKRLKKKMGLHCGKEREKDQW